MARISLVGAVTVSLALAACGGQVTQPAPTPAPITLPPLPADRTNGAITLPPLPPGPTQGTVTLAPVPPGPTTAPITPAARQCPNQSLVPPRPDFAADASVTTGQWVDPFTWPSSAGCVGVHLADADPVVCTPPLPALPWYSYAISDPQNLAPNFIPTLSAVRPEVWVEEILWFPAENGGQVGWRLPWEYQPFVVDTTAAGAPTWSQPIGGWYNAKDQLIRNAVQVDVDTRFLPNVSGTIRATALDYIYWWDQGPTTGPGAAYDTVSLAGFVNC